MTQTVPMEFTQSELRSAMRKRGLPEYMEDSLLSYVFERRPPGGFLRAALENDLHEALHKADPHNRLLLREWTDLFYWDCPSNSWGSRKHVRDWLSLR